MCTTHIVLIHSLVDAYVDLLSWLLCTMLQQTRGAVLSRVCDIYSSMLYPQE